MVKKFEGLAAFGAQNRFGGEDLGELSTFTEGNQAKIEKLADKILAD